MYFPAYHEALKNTVHVCAVPNGGPPGRNLRDGHAPAEAPVTTRPPALTPASDHGTASVGLFLAGLAVLGALVAGGPGPPASAARILHDGMSPRALSWTDPVRPRRVPPGWRLVKGAPVPRSRPVSLSRDPGLALRPGPALVAVLGLVAGLLGLMLQRERARRVAAEREAHGTAEEFRMMTENSGDMVSRIGPDRKRRYVSPACRRILGREPDELIGASPRDIVHPEDLQSMIDTLRPVYEGEAEEATSAYRIRHRDGHWVWLESTVRLVRDPVTGEPDGVLAIARDVTERKRLEAELARVATEDPLTRLANRRAFDAGFRRELHRCAGLGLPLALLLIDVDHFKQFNDHYGHPEGDACLRRVAGVIGAAAAHPVDLAARYGGEEFVLILPGLPLAQAIRRAEAIRAAVKALAIPHLGCGREAVVTVSLGLASAVPTAGAEELAGEALIRRADEGLYEAKRLGRDRTVAAGVEGVAPG